MARKAKSSKTAPDKLVETSKKGEVELTEDELKRVSGGDAAAGDLSTTVKFKFTTTTKDKIDTF
jgi:hypothetical protein